MKKVLAVLSFLFCRLSAQELLSEDGLYYEKPVHSDHSYDKYTKDNGSYKQNSIFIYDYYYADKSGKKKKFIKTEKYSEENPLHLASYDSTAENIIDRISIHVDDHLTTELGLDSSYTQTTLAYGYLTKQFLPFSDMEDEITGVIDNQKNVWLHPPRGYTFKILELNPFPFYYRDESIKHWSWNLQVGGSHYLDYRWIKTEGPLQINCDYVRGADEKITTAMGSFTCKVVKATASSESQGIMMRTNLKSYFHPDHGFMKLEYENINGSKIVIELVEKKQMRVIEPSKALPLAVYHQTCCMEYFTEELALLSDSTFSYGYHDRSYKQDHYGKWKMFQDTLILYDYALIPKTISTLTGEESFDPSLKDSIQISFKSLKEDRVLPRIFVNGRCVKFWQHRGSSYVIPKAAIKTIGVRDGIYHIKDLNANTIVINYEPNWQAMAKEWRIDNISKCLIKDKVLRRVSCDNSIDPGFVLPQK
jgi:hypothetical protein